MADGLKTAVDAVLLLSRPITAILTLLNKPKKLECKHVTEKDERAEKIRAQPSFDYALDRPSTGRGHGGRPAGFITWAAGWLHNAPSAS
jgi:hypothetical protein